ncbi:MAG: hypothetical protein WEA09_01260 [Gemmatimonadota bacterium]
MSGHRHGVRNGRRWPLMTVLLLLVSSAPVSGQWIQPQGTGWLDLTVSHLDTRDQFWVDGSQRRMANDGHAVTSSLFLTSAVGVVRGLDVWLQLPFHRLRFDDFTGERLRTGVGDPLLHVRVGPELVGLPAVPVALRGGVKWPAGDLEVDAEVIPLGDGQWDGELLLEVGRSFYPRSIWAMAWAGYRWRGPNELKARDPGNEEFWYAAVGGDVRGVGWKGALEGLRGDPWILHGISIPSARRELTQLLVTLDHAAGPGRAGLGLRHPIQGRNLPVGTALTLHYFVRWGMSP